MRGVFFGIEYDNDPVPNAIVMKGTRSGKFVKWVQEYMPTQIHREDGKTVWRERRVVQCPTGFHLRKDEIKGEMKRHKTENWQDGKFHVIEGHAIGVHIHPVKAKMEKEAKEKANAELAKLKDEASAEPGDAPSEPIVSRADNAGDDKGSVAKHAGDGPQPTDSKD